MYLLYIDLLLMFCQLVSVQLDRSVEMYNGHFQFDLEQIDRMNICVYLYLRNNTILRTLNCRSVISSSESDIFSSGCRMQSNYK